jgi:hypothetical protein
MLILGVQEISRTHSAHKKYVHLNRHSLLDEMRGLDDNTEGPAAAAPQCPEEVGILAGVGCSQFPIRRDDFDLKLRELKFPAKES